MKFISLWRRFGFGKTEKSHGAKSGEYGGYSNIVVFNQKYPEKQCVQPDDPCAVLSHLESFVSYLLRIRATPILIISLTFYKVVKRRRILICKNSIQFKLDAILQLSFSTFKHGLQLLVV